MTVWADLLGGVALLAAFGSGLLLGHHLATRGTADPDADPDWDHEVWWLERNLPHADEVPPWWRR